MANEKTPVVWDDTTNKHRPLGTGEKMGGLDASSLLSSDSGNLLEAGSDGLAYLSGSGMVDPRADNLLEDSANGKLQVTADRLAEWLDGHPQDAAALADAMNAVSGDEGNVIVQGSDNGALLTKEQIAAALAGLTDAQKQALAEALADQLAGRLADGQTIVASNGKLTSDPTNATAAEKKKINEALADADAGLVVDPSTGRLKVDFSQMDPSAFADLISDMIDAQTISTAGGGNHFYVDGDGGSDSDPATRGAPDRPFKTIQACVYFITKVYKFADVDTYINCKNINSNSQLLLPSFDATTAVITIRAASFNSSTDRANPTVLDGYLIKFNLSPTRPLGAIQASGTGVWRLENFDVSIDDSSISPAGGHLEALLAGDYTTVWLKRCRLSTTRSSTKPWQSSGTNGEHVIFISGYSVLHFEAGVQLVGSDLNASVTLTGEHAGTYNRVLSCIAIQDAAVARVEDTRNLSGSGGEDKRIVLSGIFSTLINVSNGRIVRNMAFLGEFNVSNVNTADRKFNLINGGRAQVSDSGLLDETHNNNDSTDTVLGSNTTNPDGTDRNSYVQVKTYSWYD